MNWFSIIFTVILASRLSAMDYTIYLNAVPREELNQAYRAIGGERWNEVFSSHLQAPKEAYLKVTNFKNKLEMVENRSDEITNQIAACVTILKVFRDPN